jgi:crossover junction endodeoxyribonuclease RuvC
VIILGIDPGTRLTGIGIIEIGAKLKVVHAGVIRLKESAPLEVRLAALHSQLQKIYREFKPSETVVEKIFFGKNADSAFKLGHARGICVMTAATNGSKVSEYAAKFVKKVITGTGAASKEHVRLIITQVLRYTPESTELDISDALALAVCHSQELQVQAKMQRGFGRAL